MIRKLFEWFALCALVVATLTLACCQPLESRQESVGSNEYLVQWSKLFISESPFDIRQTAVYPRPREEGLTNPTIYGITDRELTFYRCTWCHECGFKEAWDWEHYGAKQWNPRYRGEQWQPVMQRMMQKENSFLQEEMIVKRIYDYLSRDSLGLYDEGVDKRGAIEVPIDAEPGTVAPTPGTTPQQPEPAPPELPDTAADDTAGERA